MYLIDTKGRSLTSRVRGMEKKDFFLIIIIVTILELIAASAVWQTTRENSLGIQTRGKGTAVEPQSPQKGSEDTVPAKKDLQDAQIAQMGECPKLESRLYQVAQSSDPEHAANQSGLYYSQGRVRVIIELADPAVSLPAGYSLIIESRYNTLIQASVALQDLCKLSQEPSVRLVRAPYEATPLGK